MNDESKHSSVSKAYEIDQRAVKIFSDWLPDNWLPRKQEPDFFVDFLVEIVENGEPTGLHFAAQIKGYEGTTNDQKPFSYSFKTKHLKYYLNRSQHPVFLFLINMTTREGYWFFAQKHLKEKVHTNVLDEQSSLTVHFSTEDSLLNFTKFKCLLPEAERFVRDLHPGSVQAALLKRKTELESIDPRCSVSISIKDGKEHITVIPKETFSFKTKIRSKNIEGWRNFFERGAEVKLEPGEMEIIGAPLLKEAFKTMGGFSTIQFGTQYPGSIQIFCGTGENFTVIQLDGKVCGGTKFMTFSGALPESPLEITGQIPFDEKIRNEASAGFTLSLDKWTGQTVLLLSHFDQIEALVRSLVASNIPKMQMFVRGTVLWTGSLRDFDAGRIKNILCPLEWLQKCRWIAQHFNVNPILPNLSEISDEQWDWIEELYGLLRNKEFSVPEPGQTISFVASIARSASEFQGGGTLVSEKGQQTVDFLGASVPLGPTRNTFSEVKLITLSPLDGDRAKYVFETTEKTKRTSILL